MAGVRERWGAGGRFLVPASLALCALYLLLGAFFDARARTLTGSHDVWFGADVIRHIEWVVDWRSVSAARLHPGSFVLYKFYGLLLRPFGVHRDTGMLAFSLPVVLLVSAALAWSARLSADLVLRTKNEFPGKGPYSRRVSWLVLLLLLCFGPSLLLAPLPESHSLGGCALMLQALFLLATQKSLEEGDRRSLRRNGTLVFLCGLAASVFTIGNLVPAALLFGFLPRPERRRHVRAALLSGVALSAVWVAGGLIKEMRPVGVRGPAPFGSEFLYDLRYVHEPTPASVWSSFRQLVVLQFGVPFTRLNQFPWDYEGLPVRRLYPDLTRMLGPALACALAGSGLILWLSRSGPPSSRAIRRLRLGKRPWFLACGLALLSIVAVHAFFATREAYLFAPHAWPFVALPCAVVLVESLRAIGQRDADSRRARVVVLFMAGALAVSAVQIALGLIELTEHMARM